MCHHSACELFYQLRLYQMLGYDVHIVKWEGHDYKVNSTENTRLFGLGWQPIWMLRLLVKCDSFGVIVWISKDYIVFAVLWHFTGYSLRLSGGLEYYSFVTMARLKYAFGLSTVIFILLVATHARIRHRKRHKLLTDETMAKQWTVAYSERQEEVYSSAMVYKWKYNTNLTSAGLERMVSGWILVL